MKPIKISIYALMASIIMSATVFAAEAPPSVSSPFGDSGSSSSTTTTTTDAAPPSLGGSSSTTTTTTTTAPKTTTTNGSTSTSTGGTTTTKKTSGSLVKTGPEMLGLVIPSLLAGYYVVKKSKK